MAWIGWLDAGEALEAPYWPTCDLEEVELAALLAAARVQCEEFAPDIAHAAGVRGAIVTETDDDGAVLDAMVPESWRIAQAMQTRALYRSSIAGSGDRVGMDGMTVTVFPMDWTVKALLRPRSGIPRVG